MSFVIHHSLYAIQVFVLFWKVERFRIQVSAGIFADFCPNILNMFCFSDLRWGESAKRSCQKEDDEAGKRKN